MSLFFPFAGSHFDSFFLFLDVLSWSLFFPFSVCLFQDDVCLFLFLDVIILPAAALLAGCILYVGVYCILYVTGLIHM